MIYGQILQNTIMNTIIINDSSLLCLFQVDQNGNPYDSLLQLDYIFPQPGIGWWFDNIMWNPPIIVIPDDEVDE